jgi:zinc protease
VKRVAALYLRPNNRTIGMFIPTSDPVRTKVPETPDVVALLKDYTGRQAVTEGEKFEADPAAIESRTKRAELPMGAKLALLPKKSRGNKVNVTMAFHYGREADFKGRVEAAGFIDDMLSRGTSKRTRRQLADELDRLKATVNFGAFGGFGGRGRGMMGRGPATPGVLSVSIETIRENLPAVIQLTGEMLRDSTFPEKEFKKLKKQRISGAEQMRSEPMALAMMEMRRRLAPYPRDDVRYVPTVDEQIESLKAVEIDDVKKLYKELLGAGHAEIAVIGDFDPSEITNILADALKNWTSDKPFERIAMPFKEHKPDLLVINTPDKANSLFALGMNLEIRDDDPDYTALSMANYMLGQNANSRLLNRIRQKEGLSYGCGSSMQASSHDKSGGFFAFGICAPQNAEKAMACAREEIDKVLKDGFTESELADARKGYFEQVKVQLSNDGALAGMLSRDLYLGRTMQFRIDELEKIRKLTVDEINAVARKYIDPSKLVAVRAGDFEKVQEEKGDIMTKEGEKTKSGEEADS